MVKELLYDWFGLNEWLFTVLYSLHFPYLGRIWELASYGYSYWAVAFVAIALGYRYLRIRHTATEQELESMGEFMVGLIMAFSVVWCSLYTFQNVTLMPRPWAVLQDAVAAQSPVLWHEGMPASAPAISLMFACLAWKHVGGRARKWLQFYVILGCLLSIVSGVNWPVEVLAGAFVGWIGVRFGQWYVRLGRRLVAPKKTRDI
ncbi:hypothetical protein RE432_03275 [Pusillimonas sp. SM2304]|uniref:hypothetical protein n=1 Tax=Pusillimonas sp. SM2304 TaxID=3073241 RepID=UPI002876D891|nr:hypothetical protein [Pusillimonas sp. SM2304]MDS1139443.1 hypothetical protein [Pusillimonas sp. SM2304]